MASSMVYVFLFKFNFFKFYNVYVKYTKNGINIEYMYVNVFKK